MVKCKYKKECENYRSNSHTCKNWGDKYCGIYRTFEIEKYKKPLVNCEKLTSFIEAIEFKRLNKGEQKLVKGIFRNEVM